MPTSETVVLTSLSQVMQVFPEPALETFEIENSKIQGYILHESDIIRGLVNYDYLVAQQNYVEMSFQSYGTDPTGFVDFVWNPDAVGHADLRLDMFEGLDYTFNWNTRTLSFTSSFIVKVLDMWNTLVMPTTPVLRITDIVVPVEFTIIGGTLDGQRKRGYAYDTGNFNDVLQQLILNNSAVDPFIQRLCALLVVLDIIKFWIKPLYQTDTDTNIVGVVFKDKDALPGWDHMQKRLEMAIADMMGAIAKWGIKDGRVGNGEGNNPEDPSLLRSLYVATAVRGSATSSPTYGSPFMGWDDPFLFERPDSGSSLGDSIFGETKYDW